MDNMFTSALESLKGMLGKAAEPANQEPGPGDVGPTTETKVPTLVSLQMAPDEVGEWWGRVERARQRVRAREEAWDILLKEYLPIVSKSGEPETVKLMTHFRNVHTRIGQLFYRSPDLVLIPEDPGPAQNQIPNPMQVQLPPNAPPLPPLTMEDIIAVKQAVLTKKLGRDGIKANRLMDELLFDVLAWAGVGAAKLGYRCVFPKVVAPTQQPGAVLGLGAGGAQAAAPPPVPIFTEWYFRRFSPKKLLFNDDLRSTRYDEDATWMAMEFYLAPKRAMQVFQLTEEEVSKAVEDDRIHQYDDDKQGTKAPGLVRGVEIWCKASIFTDQLHPQAMNQLVLIEGLKTKPVVWRPSPDQEFDPMTGQLTKDSLIGFPIRVLTIRDCADSPYPLSDSAFTNSEIKQLTTWMRQSVMMRDASIGKYLYDMGALDPDDIERLKTAEVGAYIGVEAGKLAQGADKVVTTTAQVRMSPDDYKAMQFISQRIDETLGISAVQAGTPEETVRSATEISAVQSGASGRNDKELGRVVDFYLDAARMVDQLLMRYMSGEEYIQVTGEGGAQRMMIWNQQVVSLKCLYDIAPDSQLKVDSARDMQLDMNMYNLAAGDPIFNRAYWLRRIARRRGADPAKVVLDPAAQMMQPPHGGPGAPVNKHEASNSGGKPNAPGASNHREDQQATGGV